jgi:hypothetical protein
VLCLGAVPLPPCKISFQIKIHNKKSFRRIPIFWINIISSNFVDELCKVRKNIGWVTLAGSGLYFLSPCLGSSGRLPCNLHMLQASPLFAHLNPENSGSQYLPTRPQQVSTQRRSRCLLQQAKQQGKA